MIKYFSDTATGDVIELGAVHNLDNAKFAELFPGVTGKRCDSFSRYVGYAMPATGRGAPLFPVTRAINYKSQPSRHKCDARCMHAKGRTMNCECSCGGKNHGKGA
jgi:hypothetical protein